VSFLVPLKDGHLVQTGVVGRDGVVGALQALGEKVSPHRIAVQVPGRAAVIEAERVAEIAEGHSGVRSLFLSYEQFFLCEVQQSAACNAVHTVEQRICRWILRMNDLVGMNVAITQELLSEIIGVRRTSVSLAASSLQAAGVIQYRHGHIQIVDIERIHGCRQHHLLAQTICSPHVVVGQSRRQCPKPTADCRCFSISSPALKIHI
jgi:CRP-like cAMP-binding protein